MKSVTTRDKTIADFGDQWTAYQENVGYYASLKYLKDILGPHYDSVFFSEKTVLDVGAGTGRFAAMLIEAGVNRVVAVEPSRAFSVLKKNLESYGDKVVLVHCRGDEISVKNVDTAVCIGVLHHIPEPGPVLDSIYNSLIPGGKFILWVYGYEGNEFYLGVASVLRKFTTHCPHWMLAALSHVLGSLLTFYAQLCRWLPMPMNTYMRDVILKIHYRARVLVVYDQLNPAYAKYYKKAEIISLLKNHRFTIDTVYHRHGYSWTLVAHKPA